MRVLSDLSNCGHVNEKVNVVESSKKEADGVSSSRNLAVTVSSVCAALGLIVAAVIVCLKCRRAQPPIKRHGSKYVLLLSVGFLNCKSFRAFFLSFKL